MNAACALTLLSSLLAAAPNGVQLERHALRMLPEGVKVTSVETGTTSVRLRGVARSHEDVATYMTALQSSLLTPRGWARVVARSRDAPVVRAELLAHPDAGVLEFHRNDLIDGASVELVSADQRGAKAHRLVFELVFRFNARLH